MPLGDGKRSLFRGFAGLRSMLPRSLPSWKGELALATVGGDVEVLQLALLSGTHLMDSLQAHDEFREKCDNDTID